MAYDLPLPDELAADALVVACAERPYHVIPVAGKETIGTPPDLQRSAQVIVHGGAPVVVRHADVCLLLHAGLCAQGAHVLAVAEDAELVTRVLGERRYSLSLSLSR